MPQPDLKELLARVDGAVSEAVCTNEREARLPVIIALELAALLKALIAKENDR